MADYYHEARKAKRALKEVADDNKKRREQRREAGLEDNGVEHPLNLLQITGRSVKLHRNAEQHAAMEREDSLIAWNGDTSNLIDRFDARSLLDFYRDPPPGVQQRARTPQEEKLQEMLAFESYRDLVRLMARGLSEDKGLRAAHDENLEIRAQRRGAAAAAFRLQSHNPLPGDAAAAAEAGMYSAVGFHYGGSEAGGPAGDLSSSSSSDDDDEEGGSDDGDGGDGLAKTGAGVSDEQAAAEAEQERLDTIAERFGLADFSYRLHRSQQAEGDQDELWRWKPRKRTGRKAARLRARRLAGQGLDPTGAPLRRDWRDPLAMNAPSAHLVRPRQPSPDRSRSCSRSRSPGRRGSGLLASFPAVQAAKIDRKAFEREENILEALPDAPDPALEGPQAAAKAETPQERLKRIMAAQLNKQLHKDAAVATQKKIQAEKEKAARAHMQRVVGRSSPRRYRSRSRSPEHGDYH